MILTYGQQSHVVCLFVDVVLVADNDCCLAEFGLFQTLNSPWLKERLGGRVV